MSFSDERIIGPTKSDELDINKLGRIHPQPESPDIDMGDECSRTVPRFLHVDNVSSSGAQEHTIAHGQRRELRKLPKQKLEEGVIRRPHARDANRIVGRLL
jgi:hypothetical protein